MDFFVQSKFALAAVYARPNPAGRLSVQRRGHMYRANVGGHFPFCVIRELAEKRSLGSSGRRLYQRLNHFSAGWAREPPCVSSERLGALERYLFNPQSDPASRYSLTARPSRSPKNICGAGCLHLCACSTVPATLRRDLGQVSFGDAVNFDRVVIWPSSGACRNCPNHVRIERGCHGADLQSCCATYRARACDFGGAFRCPMRKAV
jgi:hypothetical protein